MEQDQFAEPNAKSANYFLAIIGGMLGAIAGAAIWATAAYALESYYFFIPIFVGGLAGGAASRLGGGGGLPVGIIGALFTAIGIALGDFSETSAVLGTLDLTLNEYLEVMKFTLENDTIRAVMYGAGILVGFLFAMFNVYGPEEN